MPTIILRKLSFGYSSPPHDVFKNLDLLIDTGWRAGLVGRNGRGKTTLLRLIARELAPLGGELTLTVAPRYFPFRPADPTVPTTEVIRNAVAPFTAWERRMSALLDDGGDDALAEYTTLVGTYEAHGGYSIDARAMRAADRLGLDARLLERSFGTLSPGEQTRALVASLFVADGSFALIDEPTNHLDLDGRERLAEFLSEQSGFLLVSHDRAFLDRCIDHVVALSADGATVVRASYSEWRELDRQRIETEGRRNESLKREIRSLERAAHARREGALARERDKAPHTDKGFIGRRAAKQMKRALSIEKRVERRVAERRSLLRNADKERALKLDAASGSERLVVANNLTVIREGRRLFEPVSFMLSRGERLAILGRNGAGKTSLLGALSGRQLKTEGVVKLARGLRLAIASQSPSWVSGRLDDRLRDAGLDHERFFNVMGSLGVRGDVLDKPLDTLSAGEQKKIELARTLISPADVLLWDEPLNAVDLESREQLEALVRSAAPTLVFVEHDRWFIEAVATEIVVLER